MPDVKLKSKHVESFLQGLDSQKSFPELFGSTVPQSKPVKPFRHKHLKEYFCTIWHVAPFKHADFTSSGQSVSDVTTLVVKLTVVMGVLPPIPLDDNGPNIGFVVSVVTEVLIPELESN